jgi:hypothetical protein
MWTVGGVYANVCTCKYVQERASLAAQVEVLVLCWMGLRYCGEVLFARAAFQIASSAEVTRFPSGMAGSLVKSHAEEILSPNTQ